MTAVSQKPASATESRLALGPIGVWSPQLRLAEESQARQDIGTIEELGFPAVWLPSAARLGALGRAEALLEASSEITVAAALDVALEGVPAEVAAHAAQVRERHGERFVLAVGNRPVPLDTDHSRWSLQSVEVMDAMRSFLDALDAAEPAIPHESVLLAAIERPLLELARERAGGVLVPLMTPGHTRLVRALLGSDRLLAVQQAVVYEADPISARGHARRFLSTRLGVNSYTRALRELTGAQDVDFQDGGSDELIDQLIPWGDESKIRARLFEHFEAGADHVCVQAIETASDPEMPTLDRLFLSLAA